MNLEIKKNINKDLNENESIVKEIVIEKEVEKPIEKIIEKPVFIEKEKLVTVPDIKTEAFYSRIVEINANIEELKNKIKDFHSIIIHLNKQPEYVKEIAFYINETLKNLKEEQKNIEIKILKENDSIKKEFANLYKELNQLNKPVYDYNPKLDAILSIFKNSDKKNESSSINQELKTYLNMIKTSLDKIDIKPEIKVTTQKVDLNELKNLSNTIEKNVFEINEKVSFHLKEVSTKIDILKALIESTLPNVIIELKEIVKGYKDLQEKVPMKMIDILSKSNLESSISENVKEVVNDFHKKSLKELKEETEKLNEACLKSFDESKNFLDQEIQKTFFENTLSLQKTIKALIESNIKDFLLNIKIENELQDSSDNVFSVVEFLKKTIQEEVNQIPIYVKNLKSLKSLKVPKGKIAIVNKVSFWKRNVPYIFDGKSWILY